MSSTQRRSSRSRTSRLHGGSERVRHLAGRLASSTASSRLRSSRTTGGWRGSRSNGLSSDAHSAPVDGRSVGQSTSRVLFRGSAQVVRRTCWVWPSGSPRAADNGTGQRDPSPSCQWCTEGLCQGLVTLLVLRSVHRSLIAGCAIDRPGPAPWFFEQTRRRRSPTELTTTSLSVWANSTFGWGRRSSVLRVRDLH